MKATVLAFDSETAPEHGHGTADRRRNRSTILSGRDKYSHKHAATWTQQTHNNTAQCDSPCGWYGCSRDANDDFSTAETAWGKAGEL
jgi:hypothetical protein